MNAGSPKEPSGLFRSVLGGYVTAAALATAWVPTDVPVRDIPRRHVTETAATDKALPEPGEGNAASPRILPAAVLQEDRLARTSAALSRALLPSKVNGRLAELSEKIRVQVGWLAASLAHALDRFQLPSQPLFAPSLRADGSILIEWAFRDRRLSFSIENNPTESSWSMAKLSGDVACGELLPTPLVGVLSVFLDAEPA